MRVYHGLIILYYHIAQALQWHIVTLIIHRSNVVCMLDRYETALTFTEFAAKSKGLRPQEDLTFALNRVYIIVVYPLLIKRSANQSLPSFICYSELM